MDIDILLALQEVRNGAGGVIMLISDHRFAQFSICTGKICCFRDSCNIPDDIPDYV